MVEALLSGWHYLWSFTVIISVIVFIHEFGHYAVARLCGVKIDVFSIGFGRELLGFTSKSGTRWKLSLLPFGGYVKMYGDATAASTADTALLEKMSDEEKRVSFHFKPLWQKAAIVAAGPVANFILTIAVFTYFIFTVGIASTEPVAGEVLKHSAAEAAGVKAGDRIVSINGTKMKRFNDIPAYIITNTGTEITLNIDRKGTPVTITLIPKMVEEKDMLGNTNKRPLIGLKSTQITRESVTIPQAIAEAMKNTYEMCHSSIKVLGQMISGNRSVEELKGPLGIAKMSGQVTQAGESPSETLHMILWFIALLSANLGMVNLFPIPMLDGGHLAYYSLEALRGKPVAERYMEWSYRIGFILLATLMGFTLLNDVRQLWLS
jgi:regulator of sigma E protease